MFTRGTMTSRVFKKLRTSRVFKKTSREISTMVITGSKHLEQTELLAQGAKIIPSSHVSHDVMETKV